MLVFCLRCGGFFDMDFEEHWEDDHPAPDGSLCAPEHRFDQRGVCILSHDEDWHLVVVEVEDD